MIVDARTLPSGTRIDADICVIGGGPAGITVARSLAGRSARVALLESGGLEPDPTTQELARGESVGLPYYPLQTARLRCLGGTTAHWGGWCRPLDDDDFTVRSWVPHSGWPFASTELSSYYDEAHRLCQLGPLSYNPAAVGLTPPTVNGAIEPRVFRQTPPSHFGKLYGDELRRAGDVTVYLHATVTRLETSSSRRVAEASLATLAGQVLRARASLFVLATGGLENARLLLASSLGNPELVGRFFMEHVDVPVGLFLPARAELPLDFFHVRKVASGRRRETVLGALALSAAYAARERVLGAYVTQLEPLSLDARELELSATERLFAGDVASVVAEVGGGRASKGMCPLIIACEQAPNPDSRVTLAEERDRFDVPRLRLDWRLGELDHRTARAAALALAGALGVAEQGRVRVSLPADTSSWPAYGEWHHMGTTRMHVDPRQGVVDRNCKVHELENLYVAGSSVFPTSGYANPTLTLVALSLRLGRHLREVLDAGGPA